MDSNRDDDNSNNLQEESQEDCTTPVTSSNSPPLTVGLVATPSQYENVIEDLRQRGMEDLAREILRLTAIGGHGGDDDGSVVVEAPQRQEEGKQQEAGAAEYQTVVRKSPASLNPCGKGSQSGTKGVPSPLVGIGHPVTEMVANKEDLAKGGRATYSRQLQSGKGNNTSMAASTPAAKAAPGLTVPPPLNDDDRSCSIGMAPIGLASDEKQRSFYNGASSDRTDLVAVGTNGSQHFCSSYVREPLTPMTSMGSAQTTGQTVAAPTQLARHEGTPNGHPGAYSVMPSSHFTAELSSGLDSSSSVDDENHDGSTGSTATSSSSSFDAADQGRSSSRELMTNPESNHYNGDEENNLAAEGSGALEAVRVDDIMTVKAEPLQEVDDRGRSKLYKTIACVAGAVVALAIIVSISLMVNGGRASDLGADPMALTYDAETRFRLIRGLLVRRFTPLYNINYNTTEGSQILEDVLFEPSSPQGQALDWIARRDPQMEVITKPTLDNLDESQIEQLVVHGANQDIFGGGERWLSNDELMIHDRIVQRYALAVLFFATGNWTNTYEFLSDEPICEWSGAVSCWSGDTDDDAMFATASLLDSNTTSTAGTITHLELSNNNMEGAIPLEIAALTTLRSLNLAGNSLTGTLPPALAALSELKRFDCSFNALNGTIPEVYYQNWGNLEAWIVSENGLEGTISSHIGNMAHLKEMLFVRNNIGGAIPPEFWHSLTNMEMLDLSQQSVKFVNESIGTEIGLWSNLLSFSTYGLELRGTIPSEIGMLTHLELLQLAENHLDGSIPTELGALTAMTRLSLSLNGITGTVPEEFLHLTSLARLYLQNTLLSGDVSFLCKGIEEGILIPMDPLRVDMGEVSGCYCCTCCLY